MKICMITPEFAFGGIGNYVYNLSKKLIEKGNDVTVITRGDIQRTKKEVIDGIEVFKVTLLPFYPFHMWIHGIFVNKLFKSIESRYNIVHLHSPIVPVIKTNLPILTTFHSLCRARVRRIPYDIHNFYSLMERLQYIYLSSLELKILKLSNKITTVSQINAKDLNQYGIKQNKIIIIGNGVDENFFSPEKQIENEDRYITYVGRITSVKGLFTLIKCAGYVLKEYPNVKFLLAGEGPLRNLLEKKVRDMGLQRKILFLGHATKEKLAQLYRNAYVHIISSKYEGLPNVLLEAMSSGLPIVATAVGGNLEVISSGVNGFLVSPQDPLKMAKIVIKLLNDTKLRNKIGKKARKTIEKYYTWDRITARILQCYYDIL